MDFILKIKKQHWSDALWWLFASSIGALMPTWGLWLLLRIFQQPTDLALFTQNGEFALYSASLVSTAFYLITKDYVPSRLRQLFSSNASIVLKATFPAQTFFSVFCFAVSLVSAFLFASTAFWHLPGVSLPLDINLVNRISIGLFVFVLAASYIITAIDNSLNEPSDQDYREVFKKNQDELEGKFDALGKE